VFKVQCSWVKSADAALAAHFDDWNVLNDFSAYCLLPRAYLL
jgi:hypothetical protein